MGWFKKFKHGIDKVANVAKVVQGGADKLFNKGTVAGTKLFGKDSLGSHVLRDVSKGTKAASSIAGSISSHLNKALNNPLVSGLIGSIPIVGEGALAGLHGVADVAGGAKSVLKATSAATKQKNYSGDFGDVAGQVAQHLHNITDAVQSATGNGAPANPMSV